MIKLPTEAEPVRIIQGDCLDMMPLLPADTFDSIVSDPPYGLSQSGGLQGVSDRVFNALRNVGFPDLYEWDASGGKKGNLASVCGGGSLLRRKRRPVGKSSWIGVPESAVDLQDDTTQEQEVGTSDKSTIRGIADSGLPLEHDASTGQFLGDFILNLGSVNPVRLGGDVSGGCLAEAFASGFAVPVSSVLPTGFPCLATCCGVVHDGNADVRLGDDSTCCSKCSTGVVAGAGAVNALMLRFESSGRPTELRATYRTGHENGSRLPGGTKLVRASAPASRLATVAKPHRVSLILPGADGALASHWFHLWTPIHSPLKGIVPSGGFMGKGWDATLPDPEVWRESFRVLKPGGYMLVFGGTRTVHRLACSLEDVGFEIRDTLCWLFGSGFPKAKSCLKPAYEPILLCRKPGKGMRELGIDECRIGTTVETWPASRGYSRYDTGSPIKGTQQTGDAPSGRWPANVLHDGSEEVLEAFAVFGAEKGASGKVTVRNADKFRNTFGDFAGTEEDAPFYGDSGSAARFFYCAKASKSERGAGNHHPTVKPIALMEWLVKLVTPPDGLTLDPFAGSGTTGKAAANTGRRAVLIEREAAYADIARCRVAEAMGAGLLAGVA